MNALGHEGSSPLTVSSPDLPGGTFPRAFTCDGANRLPRLEWSAPRLTGPCPPAEWPGGTGLRVDRVAGVAADIGGPGQQAFAARKPDQPAC
jgi:hypothetical protein